MFRRSERLMEEAGDAGSAGAPAVAPTPTESLLKPPAAAPAGTPAAPAPGGDELAWLPEKYRVTGADGQLDMAASSKKLGEGYGALAKKLGTGDAPPENAAAYQFQPPEEFKDLKFDDPKSNAFRDACHKQGITQAQYQFLMGEYLGVVQEVFGEAAEQSATEAREALQQVWKSPAEYEAGLSNAQRAIDSAPENVRNKLWERYGRDPEFIQFAASFGKEMGEDRTPNNTQTAGYGNDVAALMKHPAYRDAKHPEHAAISARVVALSQKAYGNAPAM